MAILMRTLRMRKSQTHDPRRKERGCGRSLLGRSRNMPLRSGRTRRQLFSGCHGLSFSPDWRSCHGHYFSLLCSKLFASQPTLSMPHGHFNAPWTLDKTSLVRKKKVPNEDSTFCVLQMQNIKRDVVCFL